jgi:hypothetical protein
MNSDPTEYELFVKELHQRIIEKQGYRDIQVQHNIKIEGKSGAKHQIDVYWRNHIAGVIQHYCVECKFWKSDVKKSDIASFISVLHDIGSARGIFVTTKGFQRGAQLLAEQNDIILVTANKIEKNYPAQLKIGMPSFENVEFSLKIADDEKYAKFEKWKSLDHLEIIVFNRMHENIGNLIGLVENLDFQNDGDYEFDLSGRYLYIIDEFIELNTVSLQFKNNFFEPLTLNGYSEVAEAVANYILTNEIISVTL